MRKISAIEVLLGILVLVAWTSQGLFFGSFLHSLLPPVNYRSTAVVLLTGSWLLSTHLIFYGLLVQTCLKLPEGEIPIGGAIERRYHLRLILQFFVIHPLLRSNVLPVPLSRQVYKVLGAKMGENSYTSGMIFDPDFVELGENVLLGHGSVLIPHVIENSRLAHHRIRIGDRVTLGAHAVVMAGAVIGNDAIIAVNSVVTKNTRIEAGEVWGGVPARKLKTRESSTGP